MAPRPAAPDESLHPGDADLVLSAKVLRIIDGDGAGVRLDSGPMKVRFYGIDAPEARAPFGREATQALARLIAGRDVELVPVSQDRYERMVAVVLVDGESVNEALIAQGHAWAYRGYLGQIPGDERYCELEAQARTGRKGLWSQPAERWVPPWIYRKRARLPPGAAAPSRDYRTETAADCIASIRQSRAERREKPIPPPADPEAPRRDCVIKGNINSKDVKIYHVPGGSNYEETEIDPDRGERWFCTEVEAREAGWRAPR